MKLTWITSRFPPDDGGMACSSGRLVNSLRDRGHALQVIHLTRNPGQTFTAAQRQTGGNPLLDNWNRLVCSGLNAPLEPERLFWACRTMMEDSVLIGFGGDQPGYLATLWGKWLQCKSVVLFRGNDFEKIVHDGKRAWLTHFVLQEADLVGAVSQEMTRRIGSLRSGKTIFTPNGIDITEWTLFESDISRAEQWRAETLPPGKPVVGMIGQLKAKKGLDLALTLFNSAEFRERVHLLTVGSLSEQLLEATVPEIHENWSQVPFQKQERLPRFYAAVDLVFIPSIYDGMPNVLLEAMALGKVVVANSAGGIPDVIRHGENGLLFDIADVSSVIQAVNTALSLTQEQRTKIGANARKTIAEQFTPQQEVERLEQKLLDL